MTIQTKQLIDGQWRNAAATGRSINPADSSTIGSYADGGTADAQAAIAAARRAFERPDWSQAPRLRQQVMLQWADALERKADELARLLTLENGKVLAQSRGEIGGAISEIRYYAGLSRFIPGHVFEVAPGEYSTLLKEPAGVAGLIIPWNAPVVLLIRALTPALAAGCTVVIKPAPQSALITAAVIAELHAVATLPKGVVNLVSESGHEIAQALVTSPEVDVISFTGSNATGQRIMAAAAPTMKKLSLELGGKSCCVVFDDCDIERIAPQLAAAATIISGQQCTAARRVLVHASRYDEMKSALTRALRAMVVAPGDTAGAQIGPLIDPASRDRVDAQIERAIAEADEVLLRGGRPGQRQFFDADAGRASRHQRVLRAGRNLRPAVGARKIRGRARSRHARQPQRVRLVGQRLDAGRCPRLACGPCAAQRHGLDQRPQQAVRRGRDRRLSPQWPRPSARR